MAHEDAWTWGLTVAASAVLAIWGRDPRRLPVHWMFKPLTVGLVIGALWSLAPAGPLRWGVLVALSLSLVGDIALMLSSRWFPVGLAAFLAALMVYAAAYTRGVPWSAVQLAYLVVPLALAVPILVLVLPHVSGGLRPAVIAYVAALVVMTWRMLSRYHGAGVGTASFAWGVAGAFLFMLSDSLLSLRRLAQRPVPYPAELGSYFAAQWCLAAAAWT